MTFVFHANCSLSGLKETNGKRSTLTRKMKNAIQFKFLGAQIPIKISTGLQIVLIQSSDLKRTVKIKIIMKQQFYTKC